MNSSVFFNNLTQRSISTNRTAEIVRIIFETLIIIFFCLFLYFIWLLLYVFFTTPHVRDNARYVLFIHMLINDTIYLSTGLILLFTSIFVVYLPVPICYVIVTLASATFRITPYNLAAMALERYVAICFPLRHLTLCTSQRSNYVIAIIWTIGLIPNIADFIILSTSTEKTIFSLNLICTRETLTINIVQNTLRSNTLIISLILVGLIIVFTYVRVIFIAKNMNSGSRSASKAGKTVMLHAFQFLLCLMSLTSTFVETHLRNYISFLPVVNFFVFTCLPRCLSPLIYGVRDHVFSKRIGQMYSAKP
ncbi:odorant receptor 131-2-like [Mixophyes fleayi]|uniref:odorant receptor 131-2-like n=1 Tax=Mixophyes fleayi TaxID=3061075 RepID=UPI003F4DD102